MYTHMRSALLENKDCKLFELSCWTLARPLKSYRTSAAGSASSSQRAAVGCYLNTL